MRILHFNTYDFGGAANGALRVHHALLASGVDSFFCASTKSRDDPTQYAVKKKLSYRVKSKINSFILDILYKKNSKSIFTTNFFGYDFRGIINKISPDIIHLHWIANNFISFADFSSLQQTNIPVVWTIRDTWPFTGGCHFFGDCRAWQHKCKHCPCFDRQPLFDICQAQWRKKKKAYIKCNPYIVSLSKQFSSYIKRSILLNNFFATHIPNTIDTKIFRPIPKDIARNLLGLPTDGLYILFGACAATSDHRKGYDLLSQALKILSLRAGSNITCLVFGASHDSGQTIHDLQTFFLGTLHDEITMALAYSAADVFVCPSREESFSNTTLESLACGTPVAGFAVGGIPDMIEHKVNGMLATPHDPQELAAGIAYILEDHERREAMGRAARRKVEENYAYPVVAKQYIELYNRILNRR